MNNSDLTFGQDALAIVSQYKGIWDSPPRKVPSNTFSDAPLLGNGDVGVVIGGNADKMRFYFGKNEFISRCEGIPKAVASVRLDFPQLADCSYHMEQQLLCGQAVSVHENASAKLSLRSWMQATDASNNLFFLCLSNEGSVPLEGSIICEAGLENTIAVHYGNEDNVVWMDSSADAPEQMDGYDTPHARLAMHMVGIEAASVRDHAMHFSLQPNSRCYLVVSLMSIYDHPDYRWVAPANVREMTLEKIHTHYLAHCEWWENFWSRSYVEIPQKDIERQFYGSLYLLACCLREGEHYPTIYGNWVMQDLMWLGSAPLNYNYEAPYYCTIPTNHTELAENYEKLLFDWMPVARKQAAKIGCSGLYYEAYPGPFPHGVIYSSTHWTGLDFLGRDCFMAQRSNGIQAASNMILRYYYTRDEVYARKIYPFLKALGDFWLDYLVYEDDRYVIKNDYYQEGPENIYPQHNPILSLGFLRLLFQGLDEISRELGLDTEKRVLWKDRLEHLSAFTVFERNGQPVFRSQEVGESREWGRVNGVDEDMSEWSSQCAIPESATLYPAGQIGPFSSLTDLEIASNTLTQHARWRDENHTCFFYPSAARVLYDPREILRQLSGLLAENAYPNMTINLFGGGIENLNTVPATLVEMLCQSYQNRLWLFANWPTECDARFGGLMAYGGFLVSAEYREGTVRDLQITSRKGRPLTLINPWPGCRVQVLMDGDYHRILEGAQLCMDTVAGSSYRFLPETV